MSMYPHYSKSMPNLAKQAKQSNRPNLPIPGLPAIPISIQESSHTRQSSTADSNYSAYGLIDFYAEMSSYDHSEEDSNDSDDSQSVTNTDTNTNNANPNTHISPKADLHLEIDESDVVTPTTTTPTPTRMAFLATSKPNLNPPSIADRQFILNSDDEDDDDLDLDFGDGAEPFTFINATPDHQSYKNGKHVLSMATMGTLGTIGTTGTTTTTNTSSSAATGSSLRTGPPLNNTTPVRDRVLHTNNNVNGSGRPPTYFSISSANSNGTSHSGGNANDGHPTPAPLHPYPTNGPVYA
ncbi:unnamed protein product [Ambrosiozyma monospora]|uniref:Unnamed protein product n=1 Tax=Ambrosiozyma monospora TaxID=43982 RepID=A0ACB5U6C6_AMBMO|nr:unnamed protein product [Ambrosiozyma monospora]